MELVVMVTASSLAKLHLHSNAARCGLDGEKVASDRCPCRHITMLFLSLVNKQVSFAIKQGIQCPKLLPSTFEIHTAGGAKKKFGT